MSNIETSQRPGENPGTADPGGEAATRPRTPELLVIEPTKGWAALKLADVWEYRGLIGFLTMRDIKVRYKQSVLGALWAIINPVFTMVLFTVFFGKMAKVSSDGLPYPIFSYAALVPWTFFSSGLSRSTKSMVGNRALLKKVYFPRLVIPISAVLAGVIDFCIAFGVLIVMMLVYGIYPTWTVVFFPFLLLLACVSALGVGLWFAALNVQFRDIGFALPLLFQTWLFVTPIAYPSSMIKSELLRTLYYLNPMAGVVEGFRWSLLGSDSVSGVGMLLSCTVAVTALVTGAFFFRRMERFFADVA